VQWRFHEFDDELRNGQGTFLFFEEIDQTLSSRFEGRADAM
jgi:hypothetical protein